MPFKPEFLGRKLKCRFCQSKFRLNHDQSTEILGRSKRSYLGSTLSRSLTPREVRKLKEHQVDADDDFQPDLLTHQDDLGVVKQGLKSLLYGGVGLVLLLGITLFAFSSDEPDVAPVNESSQKGIVDTVNANALKVTVLPSPVVERQIENWEPTMLSKVDMEQHEAYKAQVMKDLLAQEERYQHQRRSLKTR